MNNDKKFPTKEQMMEKLNESRWPGYTPGEDWVTTMDFIYSKYPDSDRTQLRLIFMQLDGVEIIDDLQGKILIPGKHTITALD
jgi:hypothetical protein